MSEDDDKTPDQIPLLHDIVYDTSLPLKAPPRPKRQARPLTSEHGPEYDPDTLDLFKPNPTREEIRAEADQIIEELVEEYSREIIDRFREELTPQLHGLLDDLDTGPDEGAGRRDG